MTERPRFIDPSLDPSLDRYRRLEGFPEGKALKDWETRRGVGSTRIGSWKENIGWGVDDLANGVTLELGSGDGNLSADVNSYYPEARIISLDPIETPGSHVRAPIEALANAIPIRDNAVDRIGSYTAIPYYISTEQHAVQVINEMTRVLAPGGEIRLFPLLKMHKIIDSEDSPYVHPSDSRRWPY